MLAFRTSVGELVWERALDSTEIGDTDRLCEGDEGDGQETVNDIGEVGLSARGGVGACSRKDGAARFRDGAVNALEGCGMCWKAAIWSSSMAMTTSCTSPMDFNDSKSGAPSGSLVI